MNVGRYRSVYCPSCTKIKPLVLSNRPDVLDAAHPPSSVEHISFSPNSGWLIRLTDGKVQHHNFPILSDLDAASRQRQRSRVRSVFFGAANSVVAHTEKGVTSHGVSDALQESLEGFARNTNMRARGVLLGRATTLCPWDRSYYFIEEQSVQGGGSRYWYNLPIHEIPPELVSSVIANEHPPSKHLQQPTPKISVPGLGNVHPPPAYEAAAPLSPLEIPSEVRNRYERRFLEGSDGRPYITGVELAMILIETGLPKGDLGSIWEKSDLNQDGRFGEEEFIQAMWLADLRTGGQSHSRSKSDSLHLPAGPANAGSSSQEGWRHSFDGSSSPHYPALQPSLASRSQSRPASYPHPPPAYTLGPTSPPPQAQETPRPGDVTMPMSKALVCRQCRRGLVPGDAAYSCQACGDSVCFCMDCYGQGASCPHTAPIVKLVQGAVLPSRKPDDCGRCWRSIKKGSLMWHCDQCYDPELCAKCWCKGKYCKHFEQGKVTMCVVYQGGWGGMRYVGGALDVVSAVIGA